MKVLITGIEGFTGQYVKQELSLFGHDVVGLQSNLLDWEAVADEIKEIQPQAVIHLAAISYVPSASSAEVYAVNTLGTQGVLESLVELPYELNKVILASSSIVYGMSSGVIDESLCPRPVNHYGCSKLAMECIARTYTEKLPVIITRPFNYTGIGQSDNFLVPKIVSHFRDRRSIIELGNIDVERDFSDVRWIAKAYRVLLNQGGAGEVYNLCSGTTTSIRSIISTLTKITGHKIDIQINPDFVRSVEIRSQCGDSTKIKILMQDDGDITMEETLDWFVQA